jgi:hypothetical protein
MSNPRSFRIDKDVLKELAKIGDKEERTVTWLLEKAAKLLIEEYKKKGYKALR